MTSTRSVLIVGGGVGGLTLAVALGQRGISADVAELKGREMSWVLALSNLAMPYGR
jgi:2-polyprenyl-6-methoxyphenol hydroxylase-like FAD-dependent oxidoreductase